MNILNDLLYFTYISSEEKAVIGEMYKADPKLFRSHLNQIFDIEFRDLIAEIVGEPRIENPKETQDEINLIFGEVAHHLHSCLSLAGKDFWHSRGVSDEQIAEFQLGDNNIWLESEDSGFWGDLTKRFKPILVWQVFVSVKDQIKTATKLFGNGHAVCCPSFDSSGVCRGIVFRIIHYKKNEHSLKNMYKFYNPFSWSYLFNFKTIEQYDELIMVEGIFDALALMRAGYKNVISPSMVKLSPYHTELLKDKKLHILFDRDRGGLEGLKFIKDKMNDSPNLLTLALCPTEKDFDEMDKEEITNYMDCVSDYDVRNLTSKPVPKHAIKRVE